MCIIYNAVSKISKKMLLSLFLFSRAQSLYGSIILLSYGQRLGLSVSSNIFLKSLSLRSAHSTIPLVHHERIGTLYLSI